jgi:Ca-activated chloride channel family protein
VNAPRENPENIPQEQHESLCAYVFGELQGDARTAFEAELAASPELRAEQARLEATIGLVKQAIPDAGLSQDARRDLLASARRSRFRVLPGRGLALAAAVFVALIGGGLALRWMGGGEEATGRARMDRVARAPAPDAARMKETRQQGQSEELEALSGLGYSAPVPRDGALTRDELSMLNNLGYGGGGGGSAPAAQEPTIRAVDVNGFSGGTGAVQLDAYTPPLEPGQVAFSGGSTPEAVLTSQTGTEGWFLGQGERKAEAGRVLAARIAGEDKLGVGDGGQFRGPGDTVPPGGAGAPAGPGTPGPASPGGAGPTSPGGAGELRYRAFAKAVASPLPMELPERRLEAERDRETTGEEGAYARTALRSIGYASDDASDEDDFDALGIHYFPEAVTVTPQQVRDRATLLCGLACLQPGESPRDMFFRYWGDNPFILGEQDALSTFAVDVDTASYTLMRAYLNRGQLPPREAVRTEEFVNYFRADQPTAADGSPFAIGLELAPTPFTPDLRTELLRVTVRAKDIADFERQPLALTFVVDVSGSMAGQRIGYVKDALTTLLGNLYAGDSVAIVAFSNESREVSPMVSAGNRGPLEQAIAALETGGGTNVEAGLRQGYALASSALTRNAVNRVILCSDGVGNIGETKGDALLALVAEQRAKGIYLNTVGVGMGNHNDVFLEQLADKGDGLCQYVDSAAEAQKVFGQDLAKALVPVARDVKIQVEFDPAQVEAWRQLGYENRALRHEDFRNDAIDAGEVNAGHQVTALYEVVRTANPGGPLATVRVRYKPPFPVDRGDTSELGRVESEAAREIERAISFSDSRPGFAAGSVGFRRSAIAAQLAEVLRRSQHARGDSLAKLAEAAQALASQSGDPEVVELSELVAKARPLIEARDAKETPRVQQLLDRLARLHFERGQRERKRLEVDEETLKREEAEIARLEAEVEAALGEQMGLEPGALEHLEDLGYGGDDR